MAIDSRYIPAFSIEDVILDKDTGAPLSGGFVYFEQDNNRGVLKPIYQITGTSPNYTYTQLPNPMELSSIGTFVDSLDNPVIPYFFPYDSNNDPEYYYVRCVASDDSTPQFAREAVPYIPSSSSTGGANTFENEISNPQFSEVLFDTSTATYVYNFNAVANEVVNIAPDWDLVVTSPAAGSVTVSQLTPAGSLNIITNPGTLLNITSAGLSSLRLRQRIYGSPNLWGNNYIAATFIAKTYGGTSVDLTLNYSQSDGTVVDQTIVTASLNADGTYGAYPDSILLGLSDSTDSYPDGYIDIYFDLPLSVEIDISSVMVTGTDTESVENLIYPQEPENRLIDHLFHYYKPQLEFKPISSFLTGWDFPLNPAQFNTNGAFNITTTAAYGWDQTIVESVVGNIAVARNGISGGFQATTANADEAFYMMQYLDGNQAKKILGTSLSCNVHAYRTDAGGDVTARVYMYRGSSSATFPTLSTSLGTIASTGVFTLTAANWTLIARGNLGQASGTLSVVDAADQTQLNDVVDLSFNGWEITEETELADTDKYAIVVTFQCPTTATVIIVDSISVIPGDIPTRPAPQTHSQVLQECQEYYEKSYANGVAAGATSALNELVRMQVVSPLSPATAADRHVRAASFEIDFNTIKRTSPTMTLYNPTNGTSNQVRAVIANAASASVSSGNASFGTNWTSLDINTKRASYVRQTSNNLTTAAATAENGLEGTIRLHYVADARLGVV